MPESPVYFLTWTTYGTWLHGDPRGSVDDQHNQRLTPFMETNRELESKNKLAMKHAPVILDQQMRSIVSDAIQRVCSIRSWHIYAINVRSNHVHIVVRAPGHSPEQVMAQLKSWSTRDLRKLGVHKDDARCWTRMGSTRWIRDERSLTSAIDYVTNHQ